MDHLRTALGNSKTAERLHRAGMPEGHGFIGALTKHLSLPIQGAIAGGVAAHEAGKNPLTGALAGGVTGWGLQRGAARQKAVAEAIAKMLTDTNGNPQMAANTMKAIGSKPRMLEALDAVLQRAKMLSLPLGAEGFHGMDQQGQPQRATRSTGGLLQEEYEKDRRARASGGMMKERSPEELADRLMSLVDKAKKTTQGETKHLLNAPDEAIVRALAVAQKGI